MIEDVSKSLNMRNIYLIILITTLLPSCTGSKENNASQYSKSLKEIRKITLHVDENTYYLSKSMFQFEEDNKEYLLFGNLEKRQHELLIYDIESQSLHKRIPLEKEGPNGLPAIWGGVPFNDSKTFLISQHNAGRITIIDEKGSVVRHYDMKHSVKNGIWADSRFGTSFFYMPSFVKDSVVYFSNGIFRQYMIGQRMKRKNWKIVPMFNFLNLKDGHIHTLPINYPDIFEDDVRTPAGGGYVFSYD